MCERVYVLRLYCSVWKGVVKKIIIIIYDAYAMNGRLLSISLIMKRKLVISFSKFHHKWNASSRILIVTRKKRVNPRFFSIAKENDKKKQITECWHSFYQMKHYYYFCSYFCFFFCLFISLFPTDRFNFNGVNVWYKNRTTAYFRIHFF